MLFIGLAVVAAFLLGLRAGFALGHRNAHARLVGRQPTNGGGKRDRPGDRD
jgi:hypothetical protein